jgi:hypothetical protein
MPLVDMHESCPEQYRANHQCWSKPTSWLPTTTHNWCPQWSKVESDLPALGNMHWYEWKQPI